jgi:hypothetical protein
MKKIRNKKPFSILAIMLFLISIGITIQSCQNELELNDVENQSINETDKTIVNNRFVFSSKQSLSDMIGDLKEQRTEVVEEKFERLYEKGFRSQIPIINPENEKLIAKLSNEKTEYLKSKGLFKGEANEDEEEDKFIADPFFASVVNEKNEIVVNDTLYKFTKEKGLFYVHVKDSISLFSFLKEEKESENNLKRKGAASTFNIYDYRLKYGGITAMNNFVFRYVLPMPGLGIKGGLGFFPVSGGGSSNHIDPEVTVNNLIQNLEICEGRSNWFQGLFGKYRYCHKYFNNSKYRMQIEFWDQRWLIYKSVGVTVQTHKKGWFWWNDIRSDELRLGINKVYLKYNYPQPNIQFQTPTVDVNTVPLYLYKGQVLISNNHSSGLPRFNQVAIKYNSGSSLPFFKFGPKTTNLLNIYIRKLPFFSNSYDVLNQGNIKKLYELGIKQLKELGSTDKEFVVTYQKSPLEIEVIYFGERYKSYNTDEIKRRFYKDWSFVAGAGYADQGKGQGFSWSFSFKPAEEIFRNYTDYKLDFYGLARRGSEWKGVRMVRN